MNSQEEWDRYHIGMAMHACIKSKDPSTKVGCILVGEDHEVLSTGFNGFPRGVRETVVTHVPNPGEDIAWKREVLDRERWERPLKYEFVEHAERNAIYNAARHGTRLYGCTAYLNYAPCPCADCTRALIQVGCLTIVGPDIPFPGVGAGTHYTIEGAAAQMRIEAGLTIRTIRWE